MDRFSGLSDINGIQTVLNSFCTLVGISVSITDPAGNIVFQANPQKICTKFHLKRSGGSPLCSVFRAYTADELKGKGKNFCRCGLVEIIAPLVVAGQHIANLFIGQFLSPGHQKNQKLDTEFFRNQARVSGYNEKRYLEVLSHLSVITDDRLRLIIDHLIQFFTMLGKRKRTEEELKWFRSSFGDIFDSMPSMIVVVDFDGIIVQWNREAERVTGLSPHKARGSRLSDVSSVLAGEMDNVRQAIRKHEPRRNERVPFKIRGEMHFLDIAVYPLSMDGIKGAVIRVDDVTERIHLEEAMIQSEKMMSVGGLAAGMAHEINNPLAGILQNVQVIRNRIDADLPKNVQTAEECGISLDALQSYLEKRGIISMMDHIMDSGLRAAQIVDNILSFSRRGGAILVLNDMRELLDKTVELASSDFILERKYDFRKIEIVREYDASVPPVMCEASKIQQVFLNLLKNGAQAMVEYPRVDSNGAVKPRFILRIFKQDEMVRIEIEDNGPGIDESIRNRVFEPFFTTRPVGVGTGLGLSVSYFIITENHRGTMEVESVSKSGTRFIICLPA